MQVSDTVKGQVSSPVVGGGRGGVVVNGVDQIVIQISIISCRAGQVTVRQACHFARMAHLFTSCNKHRHLMPTELG